MQRNDAEEEADMTDCSVNGSATHLKAPLILGLYSHCIELLLLEVLFLFLSLFVGGSVVLHCSWL